MALGYGAVYELRDLPKAVRRKFISKLLSLKRLLVSRSRNNIMIENTRPTSASQASFVYSCVIRAYHKYFFRKFSPDALCNDLIIPIYVASIVKVFEDYHDLPENRIIHPWLNNASTVPYIRTPLVYNIEMCRGFVKLPINVNANNNSSELYFRRNDATWWPASFSRCNPRTVNAQTRYQTERIFLIARVCCTYSRLARVLNILKMNWVHVIPVEKLKVILIYAWYRTWLHVY